MPVLGKCPVCKGKGKVPILFPIAANPKAPPTKPDGMGRKTCPKCGGTGVIRLGD